MKQTALTLLATLLVGTAFAASHTGAPMPEAMKSGNTQAEDAAQVCLDADEHEVFPGGLIAGSKLLVAVDD